MIPHERIRAVAGDDAKGWSAGCILAVPNEPVVNKKSGTNPRNNTIDESKDFCIQIKDWVIQRETEIKKANPSIKKVTKKIIITKNF